MAKNLNDILKEFWLIITGAVSLVVWMIRLEGKAALNSAAIEQLEKMRDEDLKSAREAREDTSKRLGEIRNDLGQIQKDIKELIRATK